jgi:soluble lytic murein transglycosylase
VTREHPLSPHRVLPLAVVALLALVAVAALRGPAWYQRAYYPLRYAGPIRDFAARAGIDPYLVAAIIHSESDFDPAIVSKAGAVGLMQITPETAEDLRPLVKRPRPFTGAQLKDPALNLELGTTYLRQLRERYGDTVTVLAAYNAGPANADKWAHGARAGGFIDAIEFPETRHYVEKVMREREIYRRVYGSELR